MSGLLSFDGITGIQGGAIAPDTNGSVGGTQFVEIVNVVLQVYNKTTGHPERSKAEFFLSTRRAHFRAKRIMSG